MVGGCPKKRQCKVKLALATTIEHPELVQFRKRVRKIVASASQRGPRRDYRGRRHHPLGRSPKPRWTRQVLNEVDALIEDSVLLEIVTISGAAITVKLEQRPAIVIHLYKEDERQNLMHDPIRSQQPMQELKSLEPNQKPLNLHTITETMVSFRYGYAGEKAVEHQSGLHSRSCDTTLRHRFVTNVQPNECATANSDLKSSPWDKTRICKVMISIGIDEQGPPCFQIDPARYFVGYKATATGTKQSEAANHLEKQFKKEGPNAVNSVGNGAIKLAITTLNTVLATDFKATEIKIGLVTNENPEFRVLSTEEVEFMSVKIQDHNHLYCPNRSTGCIWISNAIHLSSRE
ncbi:uncharacterized protein PGTG_02917 [Puccinia graminis f. sp. tritici CRL 75-36-700-3]|uniref:Uncharacterized protein n=1 Tax=Puccinia graminis f. sp. tritici (strain CRL 75-36-700-3 / race SCCL) TaxID=418459 RepID=E3JWQ1_PUCGT|nr:uncharacterized protein PGTG_02917 [Puccinia graminis f. sp. tritici CRL 75-36-700-3]EFP76476.2 hypothetical protein PGTG_02917 [Puccinia graminis f. sp. tritici CRL 75-36-700-3]